VQEAINAVSKPAISKDDLRSLQDSYSRDWDLGEGAHPCNLKSSTDPAGQVRSDYVPPPVLVA
jgi:hypothetical protein